MLQKLAFNISIHDFNVNLEALNRQYDPVCVFDSNTKTTHTNHLHISKLIAVGATQQCIATGSTNGVEQLQQFIDTRTGWLFGYLSYDLKNEIEQLNSNNPDELNFPLLQFFSPRVVLQIEADSILVFYDDGFVTKEEAETIYKTSFNETNRKTSSVPQKIEIQSKITKQEYLNTVNAIQQHIRKGDIYVVNFCQEFYARNATINTVELFEKLNALSESPFAAYGKFGKHHLMCASPERFLKKHSTRLISQPIKGTKNRSENKSEDEQLKMDLYNDPKERNENVMIVDLVRNDLSRVAKRGSVCVEELFGVYSFKQVHQLISTVSCELKEGISFTEIIKNTFPMGSMTGAPKISAMKLIELYESTKRGLYSGAIGYINPDGDFDFNVVIRSIVYNEENHYLSFMVGSAITDKANADKEYEECLLKAKAMFEVLQGKK